MIEAFQNANLVALGERHWARQDSEFRLNLIRGPAFAQAVNDIVVEFANARYQGLLDAFVNGETVAPADLAKTWRDTTQPGAWDSPVYEEFLGAVQQINLELPPGRRLRVLAADPPIDWSASSIDQDLRETTGARDSFARSVIEREVLNKDRKALVVFGSLHLCRNHPGTIVELLRGNPKARWFVILPVDGDGVTNPSNPALITLAGSPLGSMEANDVFAKGTRRVKLVDGKPVLVPAQVFEPGVKLRDVADAGLYFGGGPPEFVSPPGGLYAGTDYGREVQRRRGILMRLLPRG